MNTHAVSQQDLMAYLDGELAGDRAAEMAAHLATCRTCQETAADLQSVSRQLSASAAELPDAPGLPSNLEAALQARITPKAKKLFFVAHRWSLVVPSILAVLLAVPFLVWFRASRHAANLEQAAPYSLPANSGMAFIRADQSAAERFSISSPAPLPPAALVVHTAEVHITAHHFDNLRADLEETLAKFGGHIADLNISHPNEGERRFSATLRVPSPQLEVFLADLRKLGRVDSETLHGEEATQQSIDLDVHLANARHTEQRLLQILATRTGNLSDVLLVETTLSRVRGEIEQDEAEQKNLSNRVTFASVLLVAGEDYRPPFESASGPSVSMRLRNALADGTHAAFNALIGLMEAILAAAPSILVFGALLGLPGYWLWKKLRH